MGDVCHFSHVRVGEKGRKAEVESRKEAHMAGMPQLRSGKELLEEIFNFRELTSFP